MTTERKTEISEAVAAATNELIEQLKQGKSETLTQYLETMGKFRNYSFQNVLLIYRQRPTATRVAGFNTWKSLGRNVRKGEKGIRILAPMIYRKKDTTTPASETGNSAGAEKGPSLHGFRFVYVFDQSQSDGPALECPIARVEGEATVFLQRLVRHVEGLGITLEYQSEMEADGLSYGGKIVLKSGLSDAETLSVLAHETAHEMLHKRENRAGITKTRRETEAEAVAFVVSASLGLKTNRAAVDYIQLYNGDAELLMTSLADVQKVASSILKAIEDAPEASAVSEAETERLELPLAA
jgi:antirestriction protein ArdC